MHQSHHKNFREQVKKVTYDEICLRCALPAETLSEMIEYGVIEPLFSSNKEGNKNCNYFRFKKY